jgi:hypothetical protein
MMDTCKGDTPSITLEAREWRMDIETLDSEGWILKRVSFHITIR